MTTYTSATLVGNFLKKTLTSDQTALLAILIPAINKYIDAKTGSSFEPVPQTTRYYDGGGTVLDVEPFTELASVQAIDWYTNTAYYDYPAYAYIAEPVNETVKREIRRRFGRFERGENRIAVTAKFSEYVDSVPADIQMVATRLAATVLISGSVIAQGNLVREALEGHDVHYNAQFMLNDAASNDPFIKGVLEQHTDILIGF